MTVDYNLLAEQYKTYRTPDLRIAGAIWAHLGGARRVLNVGAGIGSYEPLDRDVVAVEPSAEMIALRPDTGATVVHGCAEDLPFDDSEFDAAMAILTIHHWSDVRKGIAEMRRVTNGNIILLTWIDYAVGFWLTDYIPALHEVDTRLFPSLEALDNMLGGSTVEVIEIPHDCTDGFMCAYWRRPEMYLDPGARKAISTFSRLPGVDNALQRLEQDLADGSWHAKYGDLLSKQSMDFGYRLVVSGGPAPNQAVEQSVENDGVSP